MSTNFRKSHNFKSKVGQLCQLYHVNFCNDTFGIFGTFFLFDSRAMIYQYQNVSNRTDK